MLWGQYFRTIEKYSSVEIYTHNGFTVYTHNKCTYVGWEKHGETHITFLNLYFTILEYPNFLNIYVMRY